jgi:hypothetical protein
LPASYIIDELAAMDFQAVTRIVQFARRERNVAQQRGLRGLLASRRLSWQTFWARRARWRIVLAAIFGFTALLIVVYLAIPSEAQNQMNQAFLNAGRTVSSLDLSVLLVAIAMLLALLCLSFVFVRPYSRAAYLTTRPSAIPPITVYVDAENQLPTSAIQPFTRFLREHLDGRHADLLYFLDASQTATGDQYKALYRFGFRPVDVPHDPTGEGKVKEAVDRELAMHAYERALRGPEKQEFIIVTGDGDYVPLIYRLVALGHRVRIWASPIRESYRTLATYLDVNVLDISRTLADLPILSEGEEKLYRVIKASLKARNDVAKGRRGVSLAGFRSLLSKDVGPDLTEVGYTGNSRLEYWSEQLMALGVLKQTRRDGLPALGQGNPIIAARQLYSMALAAASMLNSIALPKSDGIVRMDEVAKAILGTADRPDSESLESLRRLLRESKRVAHTRYFARCARALGLVNFEDSPSNLDIVKVIPLPD